MGNASTRESNSPYQQGHSRSASSSSRLRSGSTNEARNSNPLLGGNGASGSGSGSAYSSRRERDRDRDVGERARNLEHALFGLGIVGAGSRSGERNARTREEEREAREARKAEREREREKERQRSLKEESCDGGFLVTQGVYSGPQDFKDKVVRHLMLERKLAPFWKGLPDHEDDWTDAQLVAAVRGSPIPGPEVECEPETPPAASTSGPNASDSALHLSVPIGTRSRSHSYTSDSSSKSGNIAGSSAFRARSKTVSGSASSNPLETVSTTNPLETNITGRHIDGRPIEAVLYRNAAECPICFLYYPPYMNKTRCCDYDICSECFVQIKRADPHLPHDQEPQIGGSLEPPNPDLLMSEPASCPFCKETDFGVTYTPPAFRRGLVYTDSLAPSYIGASTFSPESSAPQSPGTPLSMPAGPGPRRKAALASTAAEVVTTDQIRPDWSHKLQSARNQAARRAAAATALHNAAFLLHNTQREPGSTSGSGSFASRRLMRRGGIPQGSESPSPGGSGTGTPRVAGASDSLGAAGLGLLGIGSNGGSMRMGPGSGAQGGTPADAGMGRRRTRMADLEEMMLREAIRLSILEEEARKAKEEQEAKKKDEEEKQKVARGGETTDRGGEGSASGSGSASGKGKTVDRSAAEASAAEGSSRSRGSGSEDDEDLKKLAAVGIRYVSGESAGGEGGGEQGGDVSNEASRASSQASDDVKGVEAGIHIERNEFGLSR